MKSDKHNELTAKALVWLARHATGRGIRGVDEVLLDEGYVADACALTGLQYRCAKAFAGEASIIVNASGRDESDDYSFVFETKVSRSDFRNTFIKGNHIGDRMKPKANFHYIVCAKGVINDVTEVPTLWGVLQESGNGLSIRRKAMFCPQSTQSKYEFAYRILRAETWYKRHNFNLIIEKAIMLDSTKMEKA